MNIPKTSSGKGYAINTKEKLTLKSQFNSCAYSQGKSAPFPEERQRCDHHTLGLHWNEYRQYYVGEYNFAGRNVITRSEDFVRAVNSCINYFNNMAPGSSLHVYPWTAHDETHILSHGHFEEYVYNAKVVPEDWRCNHVGEAWQSYVSCGMPIKLLLDATSPEDYKVRVNAFWKRDGAAARAHLQQWSDANHKAIESTQW